MSQFSYEPLQSNRAIRLVKFLPGPVPICKIVTVEVEKAPPYVALSYTWGSKNLSRVILANGAEIHITANLAEAIDAIFIFATERNMMFWADSICINQADVHERSSQVRLMNTIYRSAEMVAIWLGPAAHDSDLAFDKMREWKVRFDELKEQFDASEELAVTSISSDDPLFFGPCGSQEQRALEALRMIFRRPWWRRAWIVQEGTIGNPMRTILFCGSRRIDWTYLRAALRITHHVTHYQGSGMSIDFDDVMAIRLDVFRIDREYGANISLLRVLRLIRAYECEDPRDKLYSALGMAMDVYGDDIVPDYTKPSSAVYSDIVRFYISKSTDRSLDVLGEVWRSAPGTIFEHQHDNSLPSWTPDWTFRASQNPFEKVLDSDAYGEIKNAYNASGTSGGHCYIDGSHLCLQGSVLDRIIRVSSVCEWNLAARGLDLERSWIPENAGKLYFTRETLMEAFNHAIIADIGRRNFQNESELSRGFAIDWDLVGQDRTYLTVEERRRQSWMLIDTKMATFGRRLFETSRGFIGLGPAAAQIDDEICLLLGGQVCYVLRTRKDGHHEFIGECYVHGMMDGQACEDESFSIRDIVLV
ncbi:hypothetical protein AA0113_g4446 [Alternaria arborescens]|jgi:hypothetical protein|uniref:Heterokaryon incompatibility domain-containing protein n=1 Tax=Alternaria arborescens TaxID=156630 RepID=A0A4Q4SCL1_9PLEO|nr:hypothetical protein AA0113_g4446 [Alternaria arborescens]